MPAKQIRFINDAVSFLQGEVFSGAGRDYNRVLGLTLGTGLGSALYLDGHVEDADLWDSTFKEGIAEDYLSGRWFVQRYKELTGKEVKGVKELTELSASKELIKMMFLEFYESLSDFIVPLVQKYRIECVVIGGNITNAFTLFLPDFQRVFKVDKIQAVVKIANLKEDASLIGAASCWENAYVFK
jgi:glucokinase